MTNSVRSEIISIINELFDLSLPPDANPSRSHIEQWDSLKHMELILRLEEQFNVTFTIKQAAEIEDINDIINMIEG